MKTFDSGSSHDLVTPYVLVVDDDRALRFLMSKMLRLLGFEVDQAEDGMEAIRRFETKHYCLIFMDIQMPRLNGLQATTAIRLHEQQLRRTPTPIIAVTAGGATRELCLELGMTDYLAKPVEMKMLEMVLGRWKRSSSESKAIP
ncbi:MAG TPA: response regulator [Drouetiella sp.]